MKNIYIYYKLSVFTEDKELKQILMKILIPVFFLWYPNAPPPSMFWISVNFFPSLLTTVQLMYCDRKHLPA